MGQAAALGGAGRLTEACDVLAEVVSALPPDAHELRARAVTYIARLQHPLGRHGEARALLHRTLAELPERRSRAAALLELELATDHLLAADFAGIRAHAEAALELADDPLLEAAAWASLAHAHQSTGEIAASARAADRAAALVDGLDDNRAHRCSRRCGGSRPPRTCSSAGTPANATPTAACGSPAPSAPATSSSR